MYIVARSSEHYDKPNQRVCLVSIELKSLLIYIYHRFSARVYSTGHPKVINIFAESNVG